MTRLLALAVVLSGSLASAQTIYRWVDAQGTTHYSDNLASVPPGSKVTTTEGDEINTVAAPPPLPPRPARANVAAAPAAQPSNDGWSDQERYWRTQFRAALDKVRALEDEISIDQKKVDDPSVLPMNSYYQCGALGYGGYGYGGAYLAPTPYASSGVSVAVGGTVGGATVAVGGTVAAGSTVTTGGTSVTGGGVVVGPPVGQGGRPGRVRPPVAAWPGYGYGSCWYPASPEVQQARDRLERNQLALKRAKEDLSDLERRAANEAVPFEWRR